MRAFKTKFKNNRLKGNVSLLVILILLASSVIALLSINQIQHLLTYGNMTFNYFRSYYLAKAWTELWLTEVYYREAWFENSIDSWSMIVTWNLLPEYSWFNQYFTMDIESKFKVITNDIRDSDKCTNWNKIHLLTWDGIMLSLFTDTTNWTKNIINTWSAIHPLPDWDIKSLRIKWDGTFTFWIFSFNDNNTSMQNIFVEAEKAASHFNSFLWAGVNLVTGNRRYLTIKNSWTEPVDLCIFMDNGHMVPYSNSLITVRANYWDMEVWLQSIVEKTTPWWSLDIIWCKGENCK